MNQPRAPSLTIRQVVLGLFILWQLAFLIGYNVLRVVSPSLQALRSPPPRPPLALDHFVDAIEGVAGILNRWSAATGQWQGWAQFTPRAPRHTSLLAVELRWADAEHPPVRLPSYAEPAELDAFFRPFGSGRPGGYEVWLSLIWMTDWDEQTYLNDPARWRAALAKAIRNGHGFFRAYLHWRVHRYQQDHPSVPKPQEIILLLRIHRIPSPDQTPWTWPEPTILPIARWRPGAPVNAATLPIELYNPVTREFEAVRREE